MTTQLTIDPGESGVRHFFNPRHGYNLDRMSSSARKAAERDGRTTIIHMHKASEDCDEYSDHEEYRAHG